MHKTIFGRILAGAAILAVAGSAQAQIDFNSPAIEVIATRADIDAVTGLNSSSATFFSMAVAKKDDNTLFVVMDPGGATGSGVVELDIDNPSTASSVRANDAALNAVADDNGSSDQDVNAMAYDSVGDVLYVLDREDDDEIYSVNAAGTVTGLTGTSAAIGNSGIAYNAGSLFYVDTANDVVLEYDLGTSSESTLIDTATWTATAGGTEIGINSGPALAGTEAFVWNESFFNGDDNLVSFDVTTGTVTEAASNATFGNAGVSSLTAASGGVVFGWDEFPDAANDQDFVVWTGSSVVRIPQTTIQTQAGLSNPPETSDIGSVATLTDTASEVAFVIADSLSGTLIKVTFSAPAASVENWTMY